MNNLFAITVLVFSISIAGYPYVLRITQHWTERLSLAFILGSGALTFIWFAISQLGYPLTLLTYFVSVIAVFSLGLLIPRVSPPFPPEMIPKLSVMDNLLKISIWVIAGLAVLVSLYNPVISWDSLTLYDFRGIVIAQSGSLTAIELSTYHLSYPLMTSLIHALVYLLGGNNPQVFYSLTYLAILGMIYGRMMQWANTRYALLSTLLIATSPFLWEHATISYTNLPYAGAFLAGLLYLPSSLILSGILIGLTTWIRSSEPFWIVGFLAIFTFGLKSKQLIHAGIGIILALIIKYAWSLYLATAYARIGYSPESLPSIYNLSLFSKIYENAGSILSYFTQFIFLPYLGLWLFTFISMISLILAFRAKLKIALPGLFVFSHLLIFIMTIVGVAIFSTYYSSWYSIGGSATRMILFVVPIITVAGALLHYLISKHYDKFK